MNKHELANFHTFLLFALYIYKRLYIRLNNVCMRICVCMHVYACFLFNGKTLICNSSFTTNNFMHKLILVLSLSPLPRRSPYHPLSFTLPTGRMFYSYVSWFGLVCSNLFAAYPFAASLLHS